MSYPFTRSPINRPLSHLLLILPMIVLPFDYGGVLHWFWSAVAGVFLVGMAILVAVDAEFLSGGIARCNTNLRSGCVHHVETNRRMGGAQRNPSSKNLNANSYKVSRKWPIVIAAILVFPLIQLLPLPQSWIAIISPERWAWLHRAREVTGLHGWTSLSYVPLRSLSMWLWWICLAGYALLLKNAIDNSDDFTWFFNGLFLVAGFEAVYGLLQVLIPSLGVFGIDTGQVACGTFMNRDNYAAFLGMIWPLLMARLLGLDVWKSREKLSYFDTALQRQVRQKQFFLALILGLVILSLFFSESRGGILCFFVVLTVFVLFGPRAKQRWMRFLVAVPWMVMVLYGGYLGFGEIVKRFEMIGNDAQGRIEIWQDSWQLIKDNPLVGSGLDSYEPVIFLYQKNDTDQTQIGAAHNDYLQLAADMGLPFAAAIVLLLWGYWWFTAIGLARRNRFDADSGGDDPAKSGTAPYGGSDRYDLIQVGALAGMAGFLCHSWVEFNWQIPANQVYFMMLLVFMRSSVRFARPRFEGKSS